MLSHQLPVVGDVGEPVALVSGVGTGAELSGPVGEVEDPAGVVPSEAIGCEVVEPLPKTGAAAC